MDGNFLDKTCVKNPFFVTTPTYPSGEEVTLEGTPLSFGTAFGKALFYQAQPTTLCGSQATLDCSHEKEKLRKSMSNLRRNITEMISESAIILTEESLEIFDVYRLLVQDPTFERELLNVIDSGKTAFEATEYMAQKFRQKMKDDSFWQTRLYDLQYLLRQLRQCLQEVETGSTSETTFSKEAFEASTSSDNIDPLEPKPAILVASYVSPADLLFYYRYRHVVGLVLRDKGTTSHTAIVARSLRIPTLGGLTILRKEVPPATPLLVDANEGKLTVRPSRTTRERLQRKTVLISQSNELPATAVTKDGVTISLYLNANLETDFALLQQPIIQGIGLFRTEILFMLPEVATDFFAQAEEYRKIFDKAGDKPIIFRTIDMTDDKEAIVFKEDDVIKRLPETPKNPLKEPMNVSKHLVLATPMGKVLLNRHQLLCRQVRALLRARRQSKNPYGSIHIMIPMISDVVELKAYQKIIEGEALREARENRPLSSQIKIGMMIEIPSLVYQISRLRSLVDFVSIGTNDLFQFFFATNRWDTQSRRSQDVLAPAFLQFLGSIIHQFMLLDIPIHVCGEMAANPLTAMALLGLGVRRLSIAPNSVASIARMINSLSLTQLYPYMRMFRVEPYERCIALTRPYESSIDVRHTLQTFVHEQGVKI